MSVTLVPGLERGAGSLKNLPLTITLMLLFSSTGTRSIFVATCVIGSPFHIVIIANCNSVLFSNKKMNLNAKQYKFHFSLIA